MQSLSRAVARRTFSPAAPASRAVPRRTLATEGPPVSWSQYRSGEKTLAEWVDANRHVVAGSMFMFYVSLAVWNLRPGKKNNNKSKGGDESAPVADAGA